MLLGSMLAHTLTRSFGMMCHLCLHWRIMDHNDDQPLFNHLFCVCSHDDHSFESVSFNSCYCFDYHTLTYKPSHHYLTSQEMQHHLLFQQCLMFTSIYWLGSCNYTKWKCDQSKSYIPAATIVATIIAGVLYTLSYAVVEVLCHKLNLLFLMRP